jgi:serine-type D-Ala-D-Ala carboxypeptidase/endopeptidase (penicillin-binding protein 4)
MKMLNKFAQAFAALAVFTLFGSVSAQLSQTVTPTPLLNAMKAAGLSSDEVGVYVVPIGAKTPLVNMNAEKAFNPASTMKLVTTYAALGLLGADFRWKTSLHLRGALQGDVLTGDLIFKGTGDPKFVIEDLVEMIASLRKAGLREIRGDLVLDEAYFDIGDGSVDAIDGDPSQPYNVKPSATLMNFKATKFVVSPGAQYPLSTDPVLADTPIINEVTFVKGGCRFSAAGLNIRDAGTEAQPAIRISGSYSPSCGETSTFAATLSHRQFAHGFFKAAWLASGGVFTGKTRFERNAAQVSKSPVWFSWVSPRNLGEVTKDINKFSNNVMTRQVFLTTSAEVLKLPGTLERARRSVITWLDRQGLNFPELVIDNGSGLSRQERISAQHLAKLLQSAAGSPYSDLIRESLPLVGNDGTMARRLVNDPVAGRAWIKTGSLNDVRSIAGYVDAASGVRYCVVMLVNGPRAQASQAAQDALLRWVYSNG